VTVERRSLDGKIGTGRRKDGRGRATTGLDGSMVERRSRDGKIRYLTAYRLSRTGNDGAGRLKHGQFWIVGRASDRSSAGVAKRTAGLEARATRMNRWASNRSRAGLQHR
jgi:hypothetical protein